MSAIVRTFTFTDGTDAYGSQVESEIQNIVTAFNNADAGSSKWSQLKTSGNLAVDGTSVFTGATVFGSTVALPAATAPSPSLTVYASTMGLYGIAGGTVGLAAPTGGLLEGKINNTQVFNFSSTSWGLLIGGNTILEYDSGNSNVDVRCDFIPSSDNAYKCGKTGKRWSEVWAANGTIQTSVASSKINIKSVEDKDVVIPQAIYFNRPSDNHDKPQLGFLADNLPEECFAVDADGNRSTTDVYTSSVIGMLCAAVKKMTEQIQVLEAK